jgi:hypothetical protein
MSLAGLPQAVTLTIMQTFAKIVAERTSRGPSSRPVFPDPAQIVEAN